MADTDAMLFAIRTTVLCLVLAFAGCAVEATPATQYNSPTMGGGGNEGSGGGGSGGGM